MTLDQGGKKCFSKAESQGGETSGKQCVPSKLLWAPQETVMGSH